VKTLVRKALRKAKRWLGEDKKTASAPGPESMAVDNSYEWIGAGFKRLMDDPVCARRPQYVWGTLQGVALAKVLGIERVSVIEFGVASGAGLVSMERTAERCEQLAGLGIDVFGFDTGTGHPKPRDYRDMPYRWFEGYYPCDREVLQKKLRRARMIYGLIAETVTTFVQTEHPPVAFVGWDFSTYTGTRDGMRLFAADAESLLPRTPCSFRSAVGKDNCEFTGELLAIGEFNAAHAMRKIGKIPGMRYFAPAHPGHWVEMLHTLHIFDHPAYNRPQSFALSAVIDIDGRETYVKAAFGADLASGCSGSSAVRENSQ
jgi:hypothetical protein